MVMKSLASFDSAIGKQQSQYLQNGKESWIESRIVSNLRMAVISVMCSICLLFVFGCGSSNRPELVPVTGVVTMNGKPLEGARVTFVPENIRGASAETDAAGNYELIYIRDIKGAPPGLHKVFISKLVDEQESIPNQYSSPEMTTLTAEVTDSGNKIDFDLK